MDLRLNHARGDAGHLRTAFMRGRVNANSPRRPMDKRAFTHTYNSANFVLGHSALLTYDTSSVMHPT